MVFNLSQNSKVESKIKLIVKKFAVKGYNIHPDAIELLKDMPSKDLDCIISEVCKCCGSSFIVTIDDIKSIISAINKNKKPIKKCNMPNKPAKKIENSEIKILKDVSGNSCCQGKIEDFVAYFHSRYDKLSAILRNRINPIPISALQKFRQQNVEVIGMVNDIRETVNGNMLVELEDKTGIVSAIVTGKLKEEVASLLGDEVIAISGNWNGRTIIADRVIFPDVPLNGCDKKGWGFNIAFMSDTHFGSKTFLYNAWQRFINWINCEVENDKGREIAENVKYIILAGDVVDGVGIYPGQDRDLSIMDIYEQYEEAAAQIEKLPKHIKIIISPGNHDAVRQAEPQPKLPSEYASLFPKNVIQVGNPALIEIEGIKILVYHGRSIDEMVSRIPGMSYSEPAKVMIEMLKRRLLAPSYGRRYVLAPEREDYLVIDDVPDVLHTGHVHTFGTAFYRGVFLVNSSTWQSQTEYQVKRNLNPMPGIVAVYNGNQTLRLKFA